MKSRWKNSKISRGSLCYANFTSSIWENCTIEKSNFKISSIARNKLKKIEIKEVIFTGADFFQTPLKGIDFSESDINGINISDTKEELQVMMINALQAIELVQLMGIRIKE